jgi:hypothetical protein
MYITNKNDDTVEKLSYNTYDSTIYYNDEILSGIKENSNSENLISPTNIWTTIGNDSYYVSWATGTTVAAVAGAISIYLGSLNPAGVIAAMGTGTLGILAASASGGTLRVESQRYTPGFGAPQHRFVWSFTANTGDFYGNYVYHL